MNDVLDLVRHYWHVAVVCVLGGPPMLLGFLPTFVLRLGLLLYPKEHERREEFLAEFKHVPWRERPKWVAGMLPHCLFEGPPARLEQRRQTRLERLIKKVTIVSLSVLVDSELLHVSRAENIQRDITSKDRLDTPPFELFEMRPPAKRHIWPFRRFWKDI